jgi:steroid delta-isomerase-like uncharacterized protein
MTLEDNRHTVRRFFEELVGRGNMALLEEIIAPDAVHVASVTDWPPGREGFRQHVLWFRNAYPDMQITIDDLVAEGDRVIAFWTLRGTQEGEFWGVQPTGRHIVGRAISLLRVQNGQVVEYTVHPDRLGILLQLGSLGRYTEQLTQAVS